MNDKTWDNRTVMEHASLSSKAIDKDNINETAEVFSRSFYLDPLFQYFFPDESTRHKLSFYTFSFILSHAFKKGFVCTTSSKFEGAAAWFPSSHINPNLIEQVRFGGMKMYMKQGRKLINRQISATDHMRSFQRTLLPVPHLYLSLIAVNEVHRGKGLAFTLIQPMLEKADKAHLPCYLDTHNESNLELYQKFGFRVAQESIIPGSSIRHWAMIRDNK